MSPARTGGCECGRVRFTATGEPWRVGLCHCLTCRKRHGAPFNAFAVYPREAVAFTGPDRQPISLSQMGCFATSEKGRRYFCRECGSPTASDEIGGDEVELFLGSFDEPDRFAPTYESFTPRRERWLAGLPGLVRHYDGNRTGPRRTEP